MLVRSGRGMATLTAGCALLFGCNAVNPAPSSSVPAEDASPSATRSSATDEDRELFIFASGPDCFSLQVTTGQPYILLLPEGWTVDPPADGCAPASVGSSIVALLDDDGNIVAESGDVIRVAGAPSDDPEAEVGLGFVVDSLRPTDMEQTDALSLLFQDPPFGNGFVRDRRAMPSCGIIVSRQFTPAPQPEDFEYGAEVVSCVLEAFEAGDETEWVTIRDSLDGGFSTHVHRLLGPDEAELWVLRRMIGNQPERWEYWRCAPERAEGDEGADAVQLVDCVGATPRN